MSRKGFYYFFRKSIAQRKGRLIIASLSVMLAVAIVTGLAGISSGIQDKLGSELRAYGANLVVLAEDGDYLDYGAVDAVANLDGVEYATGHIFGGVFIKTQRAEVIGLDIDRLKETGWRLHGNWPGNNNEILAGINLKDALKIDRGNKVTFDNGNRSMEFTVSGFIERGGPEDNAFITSLPQAWKLTGMDKKLSAILARGKSGELEEIGGLIEKGVAGTRVKTLRQVAVAEESLLGKIQLLMLLVTVVVLFAAIVSIMSTMGANVLERREEIGLMKALGATRNNIRLFYLAEAVLIGLAGGAAGFLLGYIITQTVSWGAFDSFIRVPFYLAILSAAAGLLISLIASHFPVADALKYNPAVILREE